MSTSSVDYDALAAQHGGTSQVDYDALAAQHGGTISESGDGRNAVQRFMDNLTQVKPEQEKIPDWMPKAIGHVINQMQEFGAGTIQGAAQPIVHPVQTIEGLGSAIAHPINTGKALVASAMEHPAQTLGNLVGSAAFGEAAAPVAKAATSLLPSGINKAVLLGRTPQGAYESALKIPPASMDLGERAAAAQTGLEAGIPVTKGGADKLANLIDDMNQKRSAVIATDPTRPISTVGAVRNLDKVRAKFANQVTPQPDLAEINSAQQNFLTNPKLQPAVGPSPGSLTAQDAQAMKSGTYQQLGDKAYGELKSANIEAQKAMARGLKDEIANQFPELNNLNAAESKLLDLQPVLERAVARNSNHQMIGIGTPIVGAGVKAATGSGKLAAVGMAIKGVLDNPAVKSRLAIAVSKGGKIPYAQAFSRVQAYSASLGSLASSAQANSSGDNPTQ